MSLKQKLLESAKATQIPEGESGLWRVKKLRLNGAVNVTRHGKAVCLGPGVFTQLFRYTSAQPFETGLGECVMEDSIYELRTHLHFMLKAFGDVLITGLGLGCVVRGTLANPAVKSVTVIERDADVLKLVQPHMPAAVRIIHADAWEWILDSEEQFDCAWHDLWNDTDAGEPHLAIIHQKVIHASLNRVTGFQGAWAWPRQYRKIYAEQNVI